MTLELGYLLGPDGPHQGDGLLDDDEPVASGKAVILGLLPVVAEADTQDHPALA